MKQRWKVHVTYKVNTWDETFYVEELSELHDIIERGRDWNAIVDITIKLNV